MLIDTHVHQAGLPPAEREENVDHAKKLGTRYFVELAGSADRAQKAVDLAESREDFFCGVAAHPGSHARYDGPRDLPIFRKLIKESKKMVCVGECGLDYISTNATPQIVEKQKAQFRDMIRLAREAGLPVNMHVDRASMQDMVTILKEEKAYEVGGMLHNFGANVEVARQLLELGIYTSVSVRIHHPMDNRLRGVYKDMPLGNTVLDSDAPGAKLVRVEGGPTGPYPYDMDKVSLPWHLRYIADKLAEIKGIPVADVEAITTLNASRLFRIPIKK